LDLYKEDPKFEPPMSPETAANLLEDVEKLRSAAKAKTALRKDLANTGWQIYSDTWRAVNGNAKQAALREHEDRLGKYVAAADKAFESLQTDLDDARSALRKYFEDYRDAYVNAKKEFNACEQFRLSTQSEQKAILEKARQKGEDTTLSPCRPSEGMDKLDRLDDVWILRRLSTDLYTKADDARSRVKRATSAYDGFKGPLGTTFTSDWGGLRAVLYSALESAQRMGLRSQEMHAQRVIFGLNQRITSLADTSNLIPKDEIAQAIRKDLRGSPSLFDSTIRIATELDDLRSNLPDSAAAQTALSSLVQNSALRLDLIDRLQDPGNSVWQIITDPANVSKWNTLSPRPDKPGEPVVAFHAEGNSSVVVVRHDPMNFQTHQATNNPTALVKGQLAVSNAVSKAALTIAGAAAGLPAATPGTDDSGKPKPPTTEERQAASKEAETFATRRANAEQALRERDGALRTLSLQLSTIAMNLARAGDDPKVLAAQKEELASVLKASRVAFDAPSE
jgi:chaperonin cofactor prefoldin